MPPNLTLAELNSGKGRERLERLERRAEFLEKRVADGTANERDLSYDKGEASAIRWAISLLQCNAAELERLTAENEGLVKAGAHFVSCVLPVRIHNQPEYMEGLADDINVFAAAIGEIEKVAYDGRDGFRIVSADAARTEPR